MKALFVGIGSIGKRHIKDFYCVCREHGEEPEIHALRREITQLDEDLQDKVCRQILKVEENYDVAFITNPTFLHYQALCEVRPHTKYLFVEKPIFERDIYNISDIGLSAENTYVASPMRHTRLFKTFKKIVDCHKVYSARIICSSYLPDWRPSIDYRKNYSAIKEMGGGVALDLVHEIDYMTNLFGRPESVVHYGGKFSDLEISSDDLSIYIVRYRDMLCEVHLDYFGREYRRSCEIFTEEGTYVCDFGKEIIRTPSGEQIDGGDIVDAEFIHEMNYFYDFIQGSGEIVNSPENAMETLRIATGEYK